MRFRNALLVAGCLAASTIGSAVALAGDCWVESRVSGEAGSGESISSPQFSRLLKATELAEAILRNDAGLAAIDGVRYQINRSISLPDTDGGPYMAETWLTLHNPDVWGDGCTLDQDLADYKVMYNVSITFNSTSTIEAVLGGSPEPGEPLITAFDPETGRRFMETGVLEGAGTAFIAVRADGKPLVSPLTVEEHLAHWEHVLRIFIEQGATEMSSELDALNTHRRGLSRSELSSPAWTSPGAISEKIWGYARPDDMSAVPMFKLASDIYGTASDPGAVEFAVLSYSVADEATPVSERLKQWLRGFDAGALSSLLKQAGS